MYLILLIPILVLSSKVLATYVINVDDTFPREAEDEDLLDVKGILSYYGYPFENHEVTTEDGYVLGIHRIPYGQYGPEDNPNGAVKPTVLIMHGTDASSVDFFVLGPEKSLGLILADMGYDVWLGNNRGNTWSRKHVRLDPDLDEDFWDFSFHELGVYDDTAIIDHILGVTGNEKISYVGHSRGTTQFFVMASTKPEYNSKITLMSALGPAVYAQHLTNPIVQFAKNYYEVIELVTDSLNITEVLPHSGLLSTVLEALCSDESDLQEICAIVLFLIFGFDSDQLDRTALPTIFQNFPAGTSMKEYKHYLQEVKSGHFRQFDYGDEKNLELYNSVEPPDYDISKVSAPVALYYSENDWLVGLSDIDRLAEELPNVTTKFLIEYQNFNHLDYVFAKDVGSILYNDVIDLINLYNGVIPPTRPSTISTQPVSGSSPTTEETTPTPGSAFTPFNSVELFCSILFLVVIELLI